MFAVMGIFKIQEAPSAPLLGSDGVAGEGGQSVEVRGEPPGGRGRQPQAHVPSRA
jgi:hypothetical protein